MYVMCMCVDICVCVCVFIQDPDPESDPDPGSEPKLCEKSDPDPKKIIPDPQHWILRKIVVGTGAGVDRVVPPQHGQRFPV